MSRTWPLNLLLAAALVVASVKFAGVLGEGRQTLPEPPEPPPARPVEAAGAATPPADTYREIVEKNLFSADRGKPPPAPAETPAAVEVPKPTPPPKATLFGIVEGPDGVRFAFLTDDAKGAGEKPRKYREGDPFAGALVKEIRAGEVILAVGGTEHTVLLRTPKQGISALAPPPVAVPAPVAPQASDQGAPGGPAMRRAPAGGGRPGNVVPPARTRRPRVSAPVVGEPGLYDNVWTGGPDPQMMQGEQPFPGSEGGVEMPGNFPTQGGAPVFGGPPE